MPSLFSYSPIIRKWLQKKTQIENKKNELSEFSVKNRELLTEGLFTFTKYILIIKLYFWQIDLEVFLTFQFVTRRRLPYWCTCPRYFLSSFRKHAVTTSPCINITVCNFQSMKSPVELNSLFLKFFCYYHLV